jgi:outer membrane protein TolC
MITSHRSSAGYPFPLPDRIWIWLAVGLLMLVRPTMAQTTLDSLITAALQVSPDLQASWARAEGSLAQVAEARAARTVPGLSFSTVQSVAPTITNPNGVPNEARYLDPDVRNDWTNLSPYLYAEMSAVQPIYTWGALQRTMDAATAAADLAEAQHNEARDDVALRTGRLYFGLLAARDLTDLAREAARLVGQAKSEIQTMLNEGSDEVDDADLFEALIAEQEIAAQAVEADEQRQLLEHWLGRQVSLDPSVRFTLPAELAPVAPVTSALEDLQRIGLSARSEMAQASSALDARMAQADVARALTRPQLFVGISANYGAAANRDWVPNPYVSDPFLRRSVRVGFGIRQSLDFDGNKARIDRANARVSEVRAIQRAAEQVVLAEVEEAYRTVLIAHETLTRREEALTLSKEWLRTEQINFDLMLGDIANLVKAVKANLELRAAHIEAIQQYNQRVLALYHATGTLAEQAEAAMLFTSL